MNRISSREEAIFPDVLAQPPAEHGAFLAKAGGADVALFGRLAALVAAHEGTDSLLAGTPVEFAAVPEKSPGDLHRVQRDQARHGHKSFIARFEAERQALTMMDHPNIATMCDTGSTRTRRAHRVMRRRDAAFARLIAISRSISDFLIYQQRSLRPHPQLHPAISR